MSVWLETPKWSWELVRVTGWIFLDYICLMHLQSQPCEQLSKDFLLSHSLNLCSCFCCHCCLMACKSISILVPVMSAWHREELDDNEDDDRITPSIFQHLLREGKEAVCPVRYIKQPLVSARLASSWIILVFTIIQCERIHKNKNKQAPNPPRRIFRLLLTVNAANVAVVGLRQDYFSCMWQRGRAVKCC